MSQKLDRRRLLRELERQGFRLVRRGTGHVLVYAPGGGLVTVGVHEAGPRADRNALARLRRAGYVG